MSSVAFAPYADAFAEAERNKPFLAHHSKGPSGLTTIRLTRGEVWALSKKAASVLRMHGLRKGDCVAHYFTENSYLDVAFRLGAAMLGCVPVTINWQADTSERVLFKITSTRARLLLVDGGVPEDVRAAAAEFPWMSVAEASVSIEEVDERGFPELRDKDMRHDLEETDTRIIIFTSGTTGDPKGVKLPFSSYTCNRDTFEQFLDVGQSDVILVVANPMHHTNSTAMVDWACRRPGARLEMFAAYTTAYWSTLVSLAVESSTSEDTKIICPSVSKHYDFLESLIGAGKLPCSPEALRSALGRRNTHMLLGSAPVGPTTVARLRKHTGKLPVVRFGSTETCLQVCGTPLSLSEEQRLCAFERGWKNHHKGKAEAGYYIGQHHQPGNTQVKVVRSIVPGTEGYLCEVEEGEPGLIVTRGANVMSGYVGNDSATLKAIHPVDGEDENQLKDPTITEGPVSGVANLPWYTGLGDVGFWLRNPDNRGQDVYWQSRDNALLIKGGSNYSYDQINNELSAFLAGTLSGLGLARFTDFAIAVVGLRLRSEHEDDCWATVELRTPAARAAQSAVTTALLSGVRAKGSGVGKGSWPDFVRVDDIPVNFKGAIKVPDLTAACLAEAKERGIDGSK